jgi:phage shock protein PspC (stress-responsive transcriptional regulator)
MKKTLTANISGTVFHIEEDAFEQMHRYLESIRSQFVGSEGQDEIMTDIEARIAELLLERLAGTRQVVSIADVEHVITVMGQPEDYRDPAAEETGYVPPPGSGGPNWQATGAKRKRLFRDPDDKWIGGVLGGIGAYFSVDPLILRVIYIVLLFLGVGWLIYLILWIVVPVATTPSEKLEMRGEPVNVENIKRVFNEGTDRVRTGAERVGQEAEEIGRKYGPRARRGLDEFFNFLGDLFGLLFKAIGKVVGIVLLLGGAVLALVFMMILIGEFTLWGIPDTTHGIMNIQDIAVLIFGDPAWMNLAWLALMGAVLVPIIGIIHGGLSLLFNIASPKWFGWSLTLVWIFSIVTLAFIGMRVAADLRHQEVVETRHALAMPSDEEIILVCTQGGQYLKDRRRSALGRVRVEGNTVDLGWATLHVRQSRDTMYHLVVQRRARGATLRAAGDRAAAIKAGWEQRDNTLDLAPWFNFDRDDLFRGQNVRYILEVPVGGAVHFDASVGGMIHDIANLNGTLDAQMTGHSWTMTEQGLESDTAPISTKSTHERKRKKRRSWSFSYGDRTRSADVSTAAPWFAKADLAGVLFRRM